MPERNYALNKDLIFSIGIWLSSLVVGFTRISYSQAEDIGIFLSIFGFVANGEHLYSGIFDIKDPLFLLSGAALVKIFGPQSPFFLDVFLISIAGPAAFHAARSMKFNLLPSLIASLIFVLTLTGGFYGSIRSTLFASVLIILALDLSVKQRYFWSGLMVSFVGGFKMPYLLVCIPVVLFIFTGKSISRAFKRMTLGFLMGCVTIGALLLIRGEFFGYMRMVAENFSYRDSYMEIIGRTPGIRGHLETMYAVGAYPQILILLALIVCILAFKELKLNSKTYILAMMLLALLTLVYLLLTAMWGHHFQILSLYAWSITLLIFELLRQPMKPSIEMGGFLHSKVYKPTTLKNIFCGALRVATLVIGTLLIFGASKTVFDIKPKMSIDQILNHQWVEAPEIRALNEAYEEFGGQKSFSRLGANEDSGFGLFINKDWKLACPRTAQYGQESLRTVESILECIKLEPNYVVASPVFYSLNRFSGTYNSFRKRMIGILDDEYSCQPVKDWTGSKICIRKKLKQ